MKITDKEGLIKLIKDLKLAGCIYNEADLCQKSGVPQSYLSDMKAGRRPISEEMLQRIERAFPSFFDGSGSAVKRTEPTLDELAQMLSAHDERFHAQMDRIMDAMGLPKKEAV